MKKLVPFIFLFALLIPATASAETIYSDVTNLNIEVPDKWAKAIEGNVLFVAPTNQTIGLWFFEMEEIEDEEKFGEALGELLGTYITNMKVTEEDEMKINGMEAAYLSGDGLHKGKAAWWDVIAIQSPNGKVLVICGYHFKAVGRGAQKKIINIFQSIKPKK